MKKLITLFFAALFVSQMWGYNSVYHLYYANYSSGTSESLGTIKMSPGSSFTSSGSVTGHNTSLTIVKSASNYITMTAVDGTGTFVGWYSDASGKTLISNSRTYTHTCNDYGKDFYAKFNAPAVTNVTVSVAYATGSNSSMGTIGGGTTCASGTSVTLTVTNINSAYYFKGWSTTQNGNSIVSTSTSYSVSASNATYYAVFAAYKTSTISPTGSNSTTNWTTASVPSGYVDLGLPSGTLWSTKNLGADSEYALGNLYAWGSKTARSNSSYNQFTYTNYDATALTATYTGNSTYDVATSTNASDHTPTQAEWQELLDNCTWVWSSNKFTVSNAGQSITLLACGIGRGEQWNSSSCCYYWSSTYESGSGATKMPYYLLGYNGYEARVTDAAGTGHSGDGYAHHGMPIRPVRAGVAAKVLTIQVKVDNNVVATYTYRCDNGEKVKITADAVSGYNFVNWKNGNDVLGTNAAQEFTVTGNATYTANFVSSGYALAWDANGGSLSGTYTAAGNVSGGASITAPTATRTGYTFNGWSPAFTGTMPSAATTYQAQWTAVTYNLTYTGLEGASNSNPATYTIETATFDLANPGTRTGYTFTGWTCGGNAITQIAVGSTGDKTITANWTVNNYTVTFKAADGTTTLQGPTNYSYGATITSCPIPVQQSGNTVFAGWTLNGNTSVVYTYEQIYNVMTVTGDMVFTAKYVPALSVTIPAFTNNGKVLVTANGTTYNVTSDGDEIYVANGSNVTIQAVPNAYYHFAAWEEDDQADDFIEYRPLNASVTYTPTWEQNVTLSLVDTENEAYYTALYSNATYAGKMLTVTMTGRRLTAGSWMTFCAPFEFDIPAGHALDGAVYRFINGTMTGSNTEGYISLDFRRTHKIEANVPYLVVAKTTTDTDLEFDGVTIEDAPEQKPVVASSGDVQFVSQPWKDALVNEALELADFYIASGNTLRYAKVGNPGTTIRAFRAYFHRLRDLNATPAPRRIVISLDGVETTKEIGVDGEIEDTTRKYMENGILYIERNGVRYDAQGQRAE